jgi:hypothetical protein
VSRLKKWRSYRRPKKDPGLSHENAHAGDQFELFGCEIDGHPVLDGSTLNSARLTTLNFSLFAIMQDVSSKFHG